MTNWKTMESAPRDGSAFLVQYLPYSTPVLCMRKVIMEVVSGKLVTTDMGAWLHVHGIDDDYSRGKSSGQPQWAVAPDDLNSPETWRWCELQQPPSAVLDEIKAAQHAKIAAQI